MGEIHSLPGSGFVPKGAADPDVVADIEQLLERAQSGELRAFAYATVNEQQAWGTGWCGGAGTRHLLSTAIHGLAHRYTAKCLEGD